MNARDWFSVNKFTIEHWFNLWITPRIRFIQCCFLSLSLSSYNLCKLRLHRRLSTKFILNKRHKPYFEKEVRKKRFLLMIVNSKLTDVYKLVLSIRGLILPLLYFYFCSQSKWQKRPFLCSCKSISLFWNEISIVFSIMTISWMILFSQK